jgi:hypothetical protein
LHFNSWQKESFWTKEDSGAEMGATTFAIFPNRKQATIALFIAHSSSNLFFPPLPKKSRYQIKNKSMNDEINKNMK